MIRHVVLFKLAPGLTFDHPQVRAAEAMAHEVGRRVDVLAEWRAGRNVSPRDISYDFAVIGVLPDDALPRYLDHPYHRRASEAWARISTWVVCDLAE